MPFERVAGHAIHALNSAPASVSTSKSATFFFAWPSPLLSSMSNGKRLLPERDRSMPTIGLETGTDTSDSDDRITAEFAVMFGSARFQVERDQYRHARNQPWRQRIGRSAEYPSTWQ